MHNKRESMQVSLINSHKVTFTKRIQLRLSIILVKPCINIPKLMPLNDYSSLTMLVPQTIRSLTIKKCPKRFPTKRCIYASLLDELVDSDVEYRVWAQLLPVKKKKI